MRNPQLDIGTTNLYLFSWKGEMGGGGQDRNTYPHISTSPYHTTHRTVIGDEEVLALCLFVPRLGWGVGRV